MPHFEWRTLWLDDKGRMWAGEVQTASDVTTARKLHSMACEGHWVNSGMSRPSVTDLVWHAEKRTAIVQWYRGIGQKPATEQPPLSPIPDDVRQKFADFGGVNNDR